MKSVFKVPELLMSASIFLAGSRADATGQDSPVQTPQLASHTFVTHDLNVVKGRINQGLVDFSTLTQDTLKNPEILLECLKSNKYAKEAINIITESDLSDENIVKVIVLESSNIDFVELKNSDWLKSPKLRESVIRLFTEDLTPQQVESIANVTSDICKVIDDPGFSDVIRQKSLTHFKKLSGQPGSFALRGAHETWPKGLFNQELIRDQICPLISGEVGYAEILFLKNLGADSSTIEFVLLTKQCDMLQVAKRLDRNDLSSEVTKILIDHFNKNREKAIEVLNFNTSLFGSDEIKNTFLTLIKNDIKLLGKADPLFIPCKDEINSIVDQHLGDDKNLKIIIDKINQDFSHLLDYPARIMCSAEIRHAARTILNNGDIKLTDDQLYDLLSKYIVELPDLSSLIKNRDQAERCNGLMPDIVSVNPRANHYLPILMEETNVPYANANAALALVLDHLNIVGVSRFDNAHELIVNRFHVSSDEDRAKIKEYLRHSITAYSKYYDGINNIDTDPKLDTRPICVVLMNETSADNNGAFNAKEGWGQDDIDYLTSKYKVIYFEPSSSSSAIKSVIDTAAALGRPVEKLIIAGHGSTDGVSLGGNSVSLFRGEDGLRKKDKDLIQQLRSSLSASPVIYLMSCSTGKSVNGEPSFAEVLHAAIPNSTIFAPDADTSGDLVFDDQGHLNGIRFYNANRLAFLPFKTEPIIDQKKPFIPHFLRIIGREFLNLPQEKPVSFAILLASFSYVSYSAATYLRGLIKQIPEYKRAKRIQREERRQKKFF